MCSSESISQSPAVANTFGAQPFQFVCEVVVSSFSFGRSFVLFNSSHTHAKSIGNVIIMRWNSSTHETKSPIKNYSFFLFFNAIVVVSSNFITRRTEPKTCMLYILEQHTLRYVYIIHKLLRTVYTMHGRSVRRMNANSDCMTTC